MKLLLSILVLTFLLNANAQQQPSFDTTSLIVRFNFKLLDWDVIDDTGIFSTSVYKLLNEEGLKELDNLELSQFNLGEVTANKIFPMLQTEDSISISRHGETVSVPPFWATFKLIKPSDVSFTSFISQVHDKYPLVIYAHPNHFIEFTSPPNDTLYNLQSSIHDNGSGIAHINVDSAWNVTTGENFIKVGVFDTGIDTTHEDLSVLTGWAGHQFTDQIGQIVPPPAWGIDPYGHGTKTAGIIGAKRNNEFGISGIAGGDGSDTSGIHLLDFKFSYGNTAAFAMIEDFSALIMDAARSPGSYYDWNGELQPDVFLEHHYKNSPGYGINIGNHSYAYRLGHPGKDEVDPGAVGGDTPQQLIDNCNLCTEAYLFSLKNGVISIVGSGNKTATPGLIPATYELDIYPASFDDSWAIRVGASGQDGNLLVGPSYNWFSIWDENVDVIAPGQLEIIQTTWSHENSILEGDSTGYGQYSGTSAAAPHVSGVVALLLSHYNKPCYSNINLDMADVEYILEKSSKPTLENINSGGHHNGAGWGLLNATKAIEMIDFPEYQIIHPIDTFIERETISVDTIVVYYNRPLVSGSSGPLSTQWPLQMNRPYKVVRYEEQLTYDFSQYIQDSSELIDTWIRHSQTNSLRRFVDTTHEVNLILGNYDTTIIADNFGIEPMAQIDSIINDSLIVITGYYYHFISKYEDEDLQNINSAFQDNENYWYPINPNEELPQMAYSIYVRDSTIDDRYDFGCDSLNILLDTLAEIQQDHLGEGFIIYPNPTSTFLNVQLKSGSNIKGKIQLLDLSGRLISIHPITHSNNYRFDIHHLNSGIYFVSLIDENGQSLTKKWIKL